MRKSSNKLTKEEIINKITAEKEFLKNNFHLTEIGLFGSYVRGEQTKKSDIDILIDYDHSVGISLFELMELNDYLTELLGVKVDIALKRKLKTVAGYYILKEVQYV